MSGEIRKRVIAQRNERRLTSLQQRRMGPTCVFTVVSGFFFFNSPLISSLCRPPERSLMYVYEARPHTPGAFPGPHLFQGTCACMRVFASGCLPGIYLFLLFFVRPLLRSDIFCSLDSFPGPQNDMLASPGRSYSLCQVWWGLDGGWLWSLACSPPPPWASILPGPSSLVTEARAGPTRARVVVPVLPMRRPCPGATAADTARAACLVQHLAALFQVLGSSLLRGVLNYLV